MRILFIHHSTGANLIREGNLRKVLAEINPTLELWDHSYNLYKLFPRLLAKFTHHTGLSNNKGEITGTDYNIVLSNNSPKEYAEIFSRNLTDLTLRSILEYDIVAFKNCFPTTKIESEEQLAEDKSYYSSILEDLAKYSDHKFVLMTPPPLRKEGTTYENAQRAKKLVDWLQQENLPSNVFVFNLFGQLADNDGFLRKEYVRLSRYDSHPNTKANVTTALIFAEFLSEILF